MSQRSKQAREFQRWAERALHGLKRSQTHMLLAGKNWDRELTMQDFAFLLQVGHSVMVDKPIAVLVPSGYPPSKKLQLIADAIEEFDDGDEDSLKRATFAALRKIGVEPRM